MTAGDAGTDKVIGKGPEIAVDEDSVERSTLGQRDDRRDRARVRDEVNRRRQPQQERAGFHIMTDSSAGW